MVVGGERSAKAVGGSGRAKDERSLKERVAEALRPKDDDDDDEDVAKSKSKKKRRRHKSSSSSSSSSEEENRAATASARKKLAKKPRLAKVPNLNRRGGKLEDGEIASSPEPTTRKRPNETELEQQSIEARLKNLDKKREKKHVSNLEFFSLFINCYICVNSSW